MTTTPAPTINVLAPTGSQTGPWNTGWTYADPDDVWVYIETGGKQGPDLVDGVDYTLTSSDPATGGGNVTLSPGAVPAGGWVGSGPNATRLIIRRWTGRRQSTALPDAEGHKPRATERALDRAMRIAEELSDQLDLAVSVPPGETPPSASDLAFLAGAGEKIQEALDKSTAAVEAATGVDRNKGVWDAASNTPPLEAGVGMAGDYYIVGVAGERDVEAPLDPQADPVAWAVGDRIQFNGDRWVRIASAVPGRNLGGWSALDNVPALAAGAGVEGDFYTVTVGGGRDVEAPENPEAEPLQWNAGDQALFKGGRWERITGAAAGRNRGGWSALDNVPALSAGVGSDGDFYTVTVGGARDIEPPADPEAEPVLWKVGDQVLFKGGVWTRLMATAGGGRNLGVWDAAANLPPLTAGDGTEGDFYTVVASGARDIEEPEDPEADPVLWKIGDQAVFEGGVWTRKAIGVAADRAALYPGASSVALVDRLAASDPKPVDYDAIQFFLPTGATGAAKKLGSWNASTNSPAISNGVGSNGDYRVVTTAGSTVIDGVGGWAVNDVIRFNGVTGKWEKVADQGAAIQAMLNATPRGAGDGQLNGVYFVNRRIDVPINRTLGGVNQTGSPNGDEANTFSALGQRRSTIILGPAGKIVMQQGSVLKWLNVVSFDAATPPESQADAEARIAAWSGTAIESYRDATSGTSYYTSKKGWDISFQDVTVMGFAKGFDLREANRFYMRNVKIDCTNCVEVIMNYDMSRMLDVHCWGFWAVRYLTSDARKRNGTAIKLGGTGADNDNDGIFLRNIMVHGWTKSIHIVSGSGANPRNYNIIIDGAWLENSVAWAASRGDIGLHVEGRAPYLKLSNVHADNQKWGFYFDTSSSSGPIQMTNCSSASVTHGCLYLGAGPGMIFNFIAGGGVTTSGQPVITVASSPGPWVIAGMMCLISASSLFNSMSVSARRKIKFDGLKFFSNYGLIYYDAAALSSYVEATRTGATVTVPAGSTTDTVVVFDNEVSDGYGEYNNATGLFTATDIGVYEINVGVALVPASASASQNYILVWKNGASQSRLVDRAASSSTVPLGLSGSTKFSMLPGETLHVTIRSTVGGTIAGDGASSWLNIQRVA